MFPFGLVFNDQMFGLSIVAAGCLEEDREKHTGPVALPDSTVLFHLLNRGLWDQQLVDAPQEASSRAIRYSAVMGVPCLLGCLDRLMILFYRLVRWIVMWEQ